MRLTLLCAAALAAPLAALGSAAAQSLAQRVDRIRNGTVRLSYTARPGVCGTGRNISTHSDGQRDEWYSECQDGPVRLVLERKDGRTVDIRAYVGGHWRGSADVGLGQWPAREAGQWLLAVAEAGGPAAEEAIFPATLADSLETWPHLLRIARTGAAEKKTRRAAVFWLGQAAAEAATRGLDSIVGDDREDREVREAAIFALSQRPRAEGVPAAIQLFEELLSGS